MYVNGLDFDVGNMDYIVDFLCWCYMSHGLDCRFVLLVLGLTWIIGTICHMGWTVCLLCWC